MRDSPADRSTIGPSRSKQATSTPRSSRAAVVARPTTPAPITATLTSAMLQRLPEPGKFSPTPQRSAPKAPLCDLLITLSRIGFYLWERVRLGGASGMVPHDDLRTVRPA